MPGPDTARPTGALIVIFRALAIVVSLCGLLVGALLVLDDPGIVTVFAGKLVEGGMWTGLALFVVMAVALGCWPRDADGRLRGLSQRQR